MSHATVTTPRGGTFHLWHLEGTTMKRRSIPQHEIPFTDGDTFTLAGERGADPERVEAERRRAEDARRAREQSEALNQGTLL